MELLVTGATGYWSHCLLEPLVTETAGYWSDWCVKPHVFQGCVTVYCSGKAVGGLNLGNFFVSHRGYTRQGFDQLSTEGSDQERNNDSSDSEYEEFSTLPPRSSS